MGARKAAEQPFISVGVVAFKGGVGKSTTSAGLAQEFSRYFPTVLVDCDAQQSASSMRVTAVKDAQRHGADVDFDTVYDFAQTRIDTSLGRQGTFDQLCEIAAGSWSGPNLGSSIDTDGTPGGSGAVEQPQVMVVDSPPGVEIASGVADYLAQTSRGSLVVVTTPNDLDLADSLQTCRNFAQTHPSVESWVLLNQVIKARSEHKSLEPTDLGFRAFKTVVPSMADISRMFRYDHMRSHRGRTIYNNIAAELLQYWQPDHQGGESG